MIGLVGYYYLGGVCLLQGLGLSLSQLDLLHQLHAVYVVLVVEIGSQGLEYIKKFFKILHQLELDAVYQDIRNVLGGIGEIEDDDFLFPDRLLRLLFQKIVCHVVQGAAVILEVRGRHVHNVRGQYQVVAAPLLGVLLLHSSQVNGIQHHLYTGQVFDRLRQGGHHVVVVLGGGFEEDQNFFNGIMVAAWNPIVILNAVCLVRITTKKKEKKNES